MAPEVRELDPAVQDELLGLLGLRAEELRVGWPLLEAYAGNWHPIVALADRGAFDRFTFDPAEVRKLMDRRGWTGTVAVVWSGPGSAAGSSQEPLVVEARNLFPVGTLSEDPATGSAAAALGGYLRETGLLPAAARLTVHQGRHVGRPSVLSVEVPVAGGIRVSGSASSIG